MHVGAVKGRRKDRIKQGKQAKRIEARWFEQYEYAEDM